MSEPIRFLISLSQALSSILLYREGHPARERTVDGAFRSLRDLQAVSGGRVLYTFIGDEVVFGKEPLRELNAWDWSVRLSNLGIQRIEFDSTVERSDLDSFLEDVASRINPAMFALTSEARTMRRSAVRFGTVGIRGEIEAPEESEEEGVVYNLVDEADTIRWLHREVQQFNRLPLIEAETVIRSLTVAMHGDREIVLPLLRMRQFEEYTTTHALNVAVLSMALGEYLGYGTQDVRAFGVAGLLHDIGKVRIPLELLIKPGKLTACEREVIQRHPSDGADIIMETGEALDLAAVVAYEHHIMIDGGGYPALHFRRDCHYASKLVHLCDVYDALRAVRPYREAWSSERVLNYVSERAGIEFDRDIARAFVGMMRSWERRVAVLDNPSSILIGATGELLANAGSPTSDPPPVNIGPALARAVPHGTPGGWRSA